MRTLQEIWSELAKAGYETDKNSVHSYVPIYEKILAPYRETALNVLEIGIFKGDSIRMWRQYFTQARIVGIDCSLTPHDGMADLKPLCDEITQESNINIHIFDAENTVEVNSRFSDIRFDVIIEDAGHEISQQLNLLNIWFPYLTKNGIYIIEDIQDVDKTRSLFTGIGGHVIDRRKEKNRYDDVIAIFEDPSKIQRP